MNCLDQVSVYGFETDVNAALKFLSDCDDASEYVLSNFDITICLLIPFSSL